MTQPDAFLTDLNARRSDRFAAVRAAAEAHVATHACGAWLPTLEQARQLAATAAAARATYVLAAPSGLGYLTLHLCEVFGHTGRLDVLENDPAHASLVETAARSHGFADRINIHSGHPSEVIPSLNGPFDLILLDEHLAEIASLYDVLVRLLRSGGSLVIANTPAVYEAATAETREASLVRDLLARVASDDQLYAAFPSLPAPIIAVRRR